MRRVVVVLCALAFVVGGCGSDEDPATPIRTIEPQNTASSPSPKVATDAAACRLLTSKERASIAGGNVDAVVPAAAQKDSRQCRWLTKLSRPLPALQVVTSSAQTWVEQMPRIVDRLMMSGRAGEKFTERLQAAKKKVMDGTDELSDSDACEMFSLILQADGGDKGAKETVHFQAAQNGQIIASAQRCTSGVYTRLTYEEDGLSPSAPLSDAMSRLVRIAHKRAIELG